MITTLYQETELKEPTRMKEIFGLHLIIDAYVEKEEVLTKEHILSTFDELISLLKMEKLGEPMVREVPVDSDLLNTDEDEGGISIIVPITTSHLAIYVWPLRKALMMDIFSCKNFLATEAYGFLHDKFGFTEVKINVINRIDPVVYYQ